MQGTSVILATHAHTMVCVAWSVTDLGKIRESHPNKRAHRDQIQRFETIGVDMVNFKLTARAKPLIPRENRLVGHAQNTKELTRSLQ